MPRYRVTGTISGHNTEATIDVEAPNAAAALSAAKDVHMLDAKELHQHDPNPWREAPVLTVTASFGLCFLMVVVTFVLLYGLALIVFPPA